MTTKSRAQLALELAGITAAHPALGTTDSESLAQSLMVGGRNYIALANVLLKLVDEQATARPIAGGQTAVICNCDDMYRRRDMHNQDCEMANVRDLRFALRTMSDQLANRALAISERDVAQAELTRIKAELANSEASRAHYFDQSVERGVALSDAERTIAELKTDLAWEKGWDLCRKAQMGAVVEAARFVSRASAYWGPNCTGSHALSRLRAALSALDAHQSLASEVSGNSGSGGNNGA